MSNMKKTTKASKFVSEDINEFINESQFLKDSPKPKKTQKRQRPDVNEEEDIAKLIGQYQSSVKKRKADASIETCKESRQKLIDVMSHQFEARKQGNNNLLKSLSEILTQLEADYNAMKDNELKLEHLTGALIKCIQQATVAHKQKLKALKDIHTSFKKEVEGLLTRGAMKADDRPLWFDVYRAFPPFVEPKFARPKPEIKPIKQILYQEDIVRAEFHSKRLGLAPVNMLNPSGETQTKRLVQQYQKLKSEGVKAEELVEKSAAVVESERQEISKTAKSSTSTPMNPDSVKSQVLAEADLKNIFNEK